MKNVSKLLNTFENIIENGAFAPMEQMLDFHDIFKYIVFQRCQKALLWNKGLINQLEIIFTNISALTLRPKIKLHLFPLTRPTMKKGPGPQKILNFQNF